MWQWQAHSSGCSCGRSLLLLVFLVFALLFLSTCFLIWIPCWRWARCWALSLFDRYCWWPFGGGLLSLEGDDELLSCWLRRSRCGAGWDFPYRLGAWRGSLFYLFRLRGPGDSLMGLVLGDGDCFLFHFSHLSLLALILKLHFQPQGLWAYPEIRLLFRQKCTWVF